MAAVHTAMILVESVVCLVVWRALDFHRAEVERLVSKRTIDLRRAVSEVEIARAEVVRRLSMAVEFRDHDLGGHTERIAHHSTSIAAAAGLEAGSISTRLSVAWGHPAPWLARPRRRSPSR
jgi:response regulator RpfG family c-di-GMP phosphodiesterase